MPADAGEVAESEGEQVTANSAGAGSATRSISGFMLAANPAAAILAWSDAAGVSPGGSSSSAAGGSAETAAKPSTAMRATIIKPAAEI